jgi:hypothetical protein
VVANKKPLAVVASGTGENTSNRTVYNIRITETATAVNKKNAWRTLPYGQGTTANGDTIIFDRSYRPLLRITPDGRVEPCDGSRIEYTAREWYYRDDRDPPNRNAETRRRISELIEATPGLLAAIEARRTVH